jgi:hypothetical protein
LAYGHEDYVRSLAEFGSPRSLDRSGGWVLERPVPGAPGLRDAAGCYPLFTCRDWFALGEDLADLRASDLVSVVLVADPLTLPADIDLARHFGGVCLPWKDHYLVDLGADHEPSTHHRRNARRFLRHATVEVVDDPTAWLDTWCSLYAQLVARHAITGAACFSRESFARQLALPGAVLLRAATADDATAGLQIWFVDGPHAWHHLSAYGAEGYRWGGASYALVAAALDHLREHGVREVDLGSGAGLAHDTEDGLSRFKRGWSTHARPAWLCGAVLDPAGYAELAGDDPGPYFPAYRDPARAAAQEVIHAGGD